MLHVHHEAPRGFHSGSGTGTQASRSSHQPYLLPFATPQEKSTQEGLKTSNQMLWTRSGMGTVVHNSRPQPAQGELQSVLHMPAWRSWKYLGCSIKHHQTLTPSCCPPTLTHSLAHNCFSIPEGGTDMCRRDQRDAGKTEDEAKERIGPHHSEASKPWEQFGSLPHKYCEDFSMLYAEMGSLL